MLELARKAGPLRTDVTFFHEIPSDPKQLLYLTVVRNWWRNTGGLDEVRSDLQHEFPEWFLVQLGFIGTMWLGGE